MEITGKINRNVDFARAHARYNCVYSEILIKKLLRLFPVKEFL